MRVVRNAVPQVVSFLIAFLIIHSGSASAADSSLYRKRATWQESLLASLEAIDRSGIEDEFEPFETEILTGDDDPVPVEIDVAGARELFLFVTGDPDNIWGMGTWANARLIDNEGREHFLTNLSPGRPGGKAYDWDVLKGRHDININLHSGLYEPLRIGGTEFPRGIHVQADSEIRVPLEGKYKAFRASVGLDDWTGSNGNLRFGVFSAATAARRQLWDRLERDFSEKTPRLQMRWERQDRIWADAWNPLDFRDLAKRYAAACRRVPPLEKQASEHAATAGSRADFESIRALYYRSRALDKAVANLRDFNFRALRMAIEDLSETYDAGYPNGRNYMHRLEVLEKSTPKTLAALGSGDARLADFEAAEKLAADLETLRSHALLDNPLLDFDKLLVIRRTPVGDPRRCEWADRGLGEYLGLPKQSSWGISTIPRVNNWDNEIAVLSPVAPRGKLTTLFRPDDEKLLTDFDLHFDADRITFSMPDDRDDWQVWEIDADGENLRLLSPGNQPGIHYYDSCYLPDGRIAFISTAVLQGVPCNAGVVVGMMYRMDGDGSNIQQVCFEQDHDYTPSVLNNGRVLYLRWDYTDTPHVWNRLLMSMNPDGTGQMEYYGSNSYWPNGFFFARAIPDHPTRVVSIVTGHHEGRVGDLVIFDPAKGRREDEGVVQQIPGYGKEVEPLIEDKLTEHNWPKFLHPWPLSDKYFLVACKPTPQSLWGIYLVDVFDNMLLIREEEGKVLLEPVPFRKRPTPPIIVDRVRDEADNALVYMADVYRGPGLAGIPRGSVKGLRVFTYHFGYQRMAGIDHRVGADGPWEVKRVLGTVPVEEDGSAFFQIPAKTPISVQPLDEDGAALALMRSWFTAMPGEAVSCVGCHERLSDAPPHIATAAQSRPPSPIEPWYGPERGFSFEREVQPILDRYCVGCHDGSTREDGSTLVNLRADQGYYVCYERGNPDPEIVRDKTREELIPQYGGVFEPSYIALRKFVRVGGLESDLHVLPAMEFHVETNELIQMLRKGHHGVEMDNEAWDRLITWIDLNAPCHGVWSDVHPIPGDQRERRKTLRELYGGVVMDAEQLPPLPVKPIEPIVPDPTPTPPAGPEIDGWPLDTAAAKARQREAGPQTRIVELGDGVEMEFVRIPAGRFVMGATDGASDEWPATVVEIEKPFWMSRHEVTNEQFARFDASHDSRFEHRTSWIFSEAYLGWPLDGPEQPVVRVSWEKAMAFAEWLSERTGARANLPTEAQWEYACRAGTGSPLSYGNLDGDFSGFANLADRNLRRLADEGWRPAAPDLVVRDDRFDDGALVTAEVGRYAPNAWGLYDMHGNAAEWTRTAYRSYPYRESDGRNAGGVYEQRVVRGGSWRDRPERCRSAFRLAYEPHQRVYNVGFRVVLEETPGAGDAVAQAGSAASDK